MQQRGKHTYITIDEMLGNCVFYGVLAEILLAGQSEAISPWRRGRIPPP
jgi:hypothetical protein